jgi:DNA-directed RNA polymerase I, II, and III subunit RPABC2
MSESDVEVEFKSDDDDAKSVGSGSNTGSVDDSKNESKSVYFSDDDGDGDGDDDVNVDTDDDGDGDGDVDYIEEMGSNDTSVEKGGDDSDNDDDGGDDEDEDEDDDDDILQKFDSESKKKYITAHHPECLSFNHEETETMSRVVRDENGRIIDPYHKTLPILTKYEKTRILGIRTKQLNEGAKPYIDVNPTIIDGYIIAQLELEHKRLPFIIRRPIPNGGSELWKLRDLEIIC